MGRKKAFFFFFFLNELPLNRARNPLRNQGYMMRLTGESGGAFMGSLAEELVSE